MPKTDPNKEEKLAQRLRENLKRRKQQARGRRSTPKADRPEGQSDGAAEPKAVKEDE